MTRQGIYWPKGRNYCCWPRIVYSHQRGRLRNQRKNAAKHRLRNLTRDAFKRAGWTKKSKAQGLIGCTFDEARAWISSQFRPGMTWENLGEWEIDHIVPIASATSEQEVEWLCHYTNLRPLWRAENRAKGDRTDHLSCPCPHQPQPVAAGS